MKKIYVKPAIEMVAMGDDICDSYMGLGSKPVDPDELWSKESGNGLVFLDDEDAFEENPTDVMWNNICF